MIRRSLLALVAAATTVLPPTGEVQASEAQQSEIIVPRSVKWLGRKLKAQAAYELKHKLSSEKVEFQELAVNSEDVCYVQLRYGRTVTHNDLERKPIRRRYRAIMDMRSVQVTVENYGDGARMVFQVPKTDAIDLSTARQHGSDLTWKEGATHEVQEFKLPIRDEKLARVMERSFNRWINNCRQA